MLGQHKLLIYAARNKICCLSMFLTQLYLYITCSTRTHTKRARTRENYH